MQGPLSYIFLPCRLHLVIEIALSHPTSLLLNTKNEASMVDCLCQEILCHFSLRENELSLKQPCLHQGGANRFCLYKQDNTRDID